MEKEWESEKWTGKTLITGLFRRPVWRVLVSAYGTGEGLWGKHTCPEVHSLKPVGSNDNHQKYKDEEDHNLPGSPSGIPLRLLSLQVHHAKVMSNQAHSNKFVKGKFIAKTSL